MYTYNQGNTQKLAPLENITKVYLSERTITTNIPDSLYDWVRLLRAIPTTPL